MNVPRMLRWRLQKQCMITEQRFRLSAGPAPPNKWLLLLDFSHARTS
jgi:hypothetical protein